MRLLLTGGCALLAVACSSTGDKTAGLRAEPPSKSGNPLNYEVFGKRYAILGTSEGYRERGIASWYGDDFHGKRTSSGAPFDMYSISAAHKTLPIPTWVKVTHLANGKSLVLRINDRGPFVGDRVIDLSYAAAKELGMTSKGTGEVLIEAIPPYQTLADAGRRPRPAGATGATLVASASPVPTPLPAAAAPLEPVSSASVVVAAATPPEPPPVAAPVMAAPAPAAVPARTLAAATPRAASPLPPTNGGVFLQIAAFSDRRNAENLRLRVRPQFAQGIYLDDSRGDGLTRVKMGPFLSPIDAERAIARVDTLGLGHPRMVID